MEKVFAKSCVVRTLFMNSSIRRELTLTHPRAIGSVPKLIRNWSGLKKALTRFSGPIGRGLKLTSRRSNCGRIRLCP